MTDQPRSRVKDLWQLHLPLVIVLAFCTVATIVEFQRARQGVDRAWAYTFQWPIIGAFAVVVWNRYRKHGSITRSISDYFRKRVARFEAEALAEEEREKLETLKAKARMAHTMVHPRASKVIDTKADADVVTPSDAEQEAEMPRMHARIAAKSVP